MGLKCIIKCNFTSFFLKCGYWKVYSYIVVCIVFLLDSIFFYTNIQKLFANVFITVNISLFLSHCKFLKDWDIVLKKKISDFHVLHVIFNKCTMNWAIQTLLGSCGQFSGFLKGKFRLNFSDLQEFQICNPKCFLRFMPQQMTSCRGKDI